MPSNRKSLVFALSVSTLLWGASSMPAHAYLDPGTGSMMLQVLLGGVAGLALAGRFYWQKLLEMLGVRSAVPAPDEAESPATARSETRGEM